MAYSELIKNFDRIRDYMRQFYIYGFKSRTEYDKKSARSYDNERRRMESWLGDHMRFRQTPEGKNVFLCVDSRSIPENPLHNAFKAKSFTDGDVTFHFYILDILQEGEAFTVQEILDIIFDKYLRHFESQWQPDISTVRKKLKEYVSLGILRSEKQGRELYYSRTEDTVDLTRWADALSFYTEMDPMGVIGSTLLDKLDGKPDHFQFKHHYMLHALDSQILLQLLTAIGERRHIKFVNVSRRRADSTFWHYVLPLKIYVSTQGGRQYLLCYHNRFHALQFFRIDYIKQIEILEGETHPDRYNNYCQKFRSHLWGTSDGTGFNVDHLEMTLHFDDDEQYIPRRLEREKRNGTVELIDQNTCKYIVDTYDASELIPWLRTFIGRIEKLECTDEKVVRRFYADLDLMCKQYGGEG
jgi:hypothetical protein